MGSVGHLVSGTPCGPIDLSALSLGWASEMALISFQLMDPWGEVEIKKGDASVKCIQRADSMHGTVLIFVTFPSSPSL